MHALLLTVLLSAAPADDRQAYADAYREAVRANRRLVVWVGQEPAGGTTWLSCRVGSFPGVATTGAVLAAPDGTGGLWRLRDLSGPVTADQVRAAFDPPVYYPPMRYAAPASC